MKRDIELGQTVAASLSAPTLFTIAQDLREIDIYANIDEADVGRLKAGQKVGFTVNAYPNRSFEGSVRMVRLSRADGAERGDLHRRDRRRETWIRRSCPA